ncbi:hypothetical protein GOBAR_DD28316 [Gossypium barbadense]|nr:hypothetical protein GOBAR_DD28316 [Gossypium barbadense]
MQLFSIAAFGFVDPKPYSSSQAGVPAMTSSSSYERNLFHGKKIHSAVETLTENVGCISRGRQDLERERRVLSIAMAMASH